MLERTAARCDSALSFNGKPVEDFLAVGLSDDVLARQRVNLCV